MKTFTNYMPGARGINVKGGNTVWIEPGQSVDIDPDTIEGAVPDLGKPPVAEGELDAANAQLTERVTALEAENAELRGQLKPYLVKDAVASLDSTNDAHWTGAGLPRTDAVSAIVGSDVSRADIEAAAPDAKRTA